MLKGWGQEWGQWHRRKGNLTLYTRREEVQMASATGRLVEESCRRKGHDGIYVLNKLRGRQCHLLTLSWVVMERVMKGTVRVYNYSEGSGEG